MKNETTKSEATLSEILRSKQVVSDLTKSSEVKLKSLENRVSSLQHDFAKKQAAFEDEFTGNFEMIKDIVLHTDQQNMLKVKEQERKFTESHQKLVDMVKQKHAQFDALLEKLIMQSNTESSVNGD